MASSSIPCLSSRTYPVETGTPPYWQSAGSMSETFLLFRQIVHLHGLSPLFFGRLLFGEAIFGPCAISCGESGDEEVVFLGLRCGLRLATLFPARFVGGVFYSQVVCKYLT